MFLDKMPKFTAGRVLKSDMLVSLRDYPRDYIAILYSGYSDGVIAGCNIIVNSDVLVVTPGMVRYKEQFYILNQNTTVPYTTNGQDTMIKIRFAKEKESEDYVLAQGNIISESGYKIGENELELCRFKLKPGARLRDEYQDFTDFATEYDTVNRINVPVAAPEQSTLPPFITRRFAQEAFEGRPVHPFDYTFISQCAQGEPVSRLLITAYTSARLGIVAKDSSNQDIHRQLEKILEDIRLGKDMATAARRNGGRKILVD